MNTDVFHVDDMRRQSIPDYECLPTPAMLSYVPVEEAIRKLDGSGMPNVYYLYVSHEDVSLAISIARHFGNLHSSWLNVLPRGGLASLDEWYVAFNGRFVGSKWR